jgi:hypothetical protein
MADPLGTSSNDLADWLRRWLVIGGYCLAGWQFFVMVLAIVTFGPRLRFYLRMDWQGVNGLLVGGVYLISLIFLAIGCWGLQHYRRWARPMLLTYAGTWIFGQLARAVVSCVWFYQRSGHYFRSTDPLEVLLGMTNFYVDPAVYACVNAVTLILCLRRPELTDQFPEARRGFAPVIRDESGSK